MLTGAQIDERITQLRDIVEQCSCMAAGAGAELARWAEAGARFEELREEYRARPVSFNGRTELLAELRRRMDLALAARLGEVIDRFHAVGEQLRRAEQERELWRHVIIACAGEAAHTRLEGAAAVVEVRATPIRQTPPSGTVQRRELEQAICGAGAWDLVSTLSSARFEKALREKRLLGLPEELLDRLCPRQVRHRVASY